MTSALPLDKLRKAGIRHYDELIHDQDKNWLIANFSSGARKYPVNVSHLMRNIIWQMRERVQRGDKPPLQELIRTFWYMYVKPTLSRAESLAENVDQYKQLVDQFVYLVKELRLMEYRDIGFRDDNEAHRTVGRQAHIILFSEKLGHQSFLSEMAEIYDVSILALGGQPSVLNVEYFVRELREAGVNLRRSFYLFSIVDYDTSGWIVRDAFVDDLRRYGIKNIRVTDLIHPDMLTPEEIAMSRYRLPASKNMRRKNQTWLKEIRAQRYANQKYLQETRGGGSVLYGLEAESISGKRLATRLDKMFRPLLGKTEAFIERYELRNLTKAIEELMIYRLTGNVSEYPRR
jgi:hypothetical protein